MQIKRRETSQMVHRLFYIGHRWLNILSEVFTTVLLDRTLCNCFQVVVSILIRGPPYSDVVPTNIVNIYICVLLVLKYGYMFAYMHVFVLRRLFIYTWSYTRLCTHISTRTRICKANRFYQFDFRRLSIPSFV